MNVQDGPQQPGWYGQRGLSFAGKRADIRQRGHIDSVAGFGDLLRRIRRNRVRLGLWVAACVVLASAALGLLTPKFDATAEVVLEARVPVVTGSGADQSISNLGPTLDSSQADSQASVIKSERVLRFVFDTLDLGRDPSFAPKPPGPVGRLIGGIVDRIPFLAKAPLTPEEERAAADAKAFQAFSDGLTVKRVGQSYVIDITFRAPDPGQAAHLANAITASYIRDLVLYRASTIQRGVEFLQNRTSAIQAQVDAAAGAVKSGVMPDVQFGDSDARVTGAAEVPQSKAFPIVSLILALAIAAGLVTGLGVVFVRYKLDRTVHSRQQVAQTLDIDLINVLPHYVDRRAPRGSRMPAAAISEPWGADFLEALRVLRTTVLSADTSIDHVAIGVVSWSSGEGRSTIASNLARIVAASRERVVLIDGDLRNPALTRVLAADAAEGLDAALLSHSTLTAPLAVDLSPTLSFIPAVAGGRGGDPDAFLGVPEMASLMRHLRTNRDVIIDLPPLSLSSDAQAIGHLLDGVVLVVEAERTTVDDIHDACRALDVFNTRLLTVALNKAPPSGAEGPSSRTRRGRG